MKLNNPVHPFTLRQLSLFACVLFVWLPAADVAAQTKTSSPQASLRGKALIGGTLFVDEVKIIVIPQRTEGRPAGRPVPAFVDNTGEYRISNLSPGPYNLKATGAGIRYKEMPIEIEPGNSNVIDIDLEEAPSHARVRATVLDEYGRPVIDAQIAIYSSALPPSLCANCQLAEAASDRNGEVIYARLGGQQSYILAIKNDQASKSKRGAASGAAIGAIIGSIAGGGKGAGIGAVVGAGTSMPPVLMATESIAIGEEPEALIKLQIGTGPRPELTATVLTKPLSPSYEKTPPKDDAVAVVGEKAGASSGPPDGQRITMPAPSYTTTPTTAASGNNSNSTGATQVSGGANANSSITMIEPQPGSGAAKSSGGSRMKGGTRRRARSSSAIVHGGRASAFRFNLPMLILHRASETASPGQEIELPLTVRNTGDEATQFRLVAEAPAEYRPTFNSIESVSGAGLPILLTPSLTRGASIEVTLNLRVPVTAADGERQAFQVRLQSSSGGEIVTAADGIIKVAAPTLNVGASVSEASVMPGETFKQIVTVRNQGSVTASGTRADFVFNPNFELVGASPEPRAYDTASRTASWNLGNVEAGGTRQITATLRVASGALAETSLLGRGIVHTLSLPSRSSFYSSSLIIGRVSRARLDARSARLNATPGETVDIPFVARNPGNGSDSYQLLVRTSNAPAPLIYADPNADGRHQDDEPVVAETTQLAPVDGQFPLLLRARIPATTPDRRQYSYTVIARSLSGKRVTSEASTTLTVEAPRIAMRAEQLAANPAPGDNVSYNLLLVNKGSGTAKNLTIAEILPDGLQFVSSDPAVKPEDASEAAGPLVWQVSELAPGQTLALRITVRLRPGKAAGARFKTRHTVTYQDRQGNRYQNR